jgi:hypothetical protein
VKVYITKYALTSTGIYATEVENAPGYPDFVKTVDGTPEYFNRSEWTYGRELAKSRALQMQVEAIVNARLVLESIINHKIEIHE